MKPYSPSFRLAHVLKPRPEPQAAAFGFSFDEGGASENPPAHSVLDSALSGPLPGSRSLQIWLQNFPLAGRGWGGWSEWGTFIFLSATPYHEGELGKRKRLGGTVALRGKDRPSSCGPLEEAGRCSVLPRGWGEPAWEAQGAPPPPCPPPVYL